MDAPVVVSRVESVTVFRRGAAVTRISDLPPPLARPGTVRLSGLPLALDDASLRVRLSAAGGAPAPLVAASVRIALEVPEPDASLPPPDDAALKEARRQERHLASVLEGVERLRASLEAAPSPRRPAGRRGEAPPPAPWDARRAFAAFRRRECERLDAEAERLRVSLREAGRRREELEERDRRASTARQAREHELRKATLIELRGEPCAEPLVLSVEYLVPGARWAPSYGFHVEEDGQGRLALRAVVRQRTGEDWTGVRLLLTTADAHAWVELPELPSLRIGRHQPRPTRRGFRPAPEGAEALYADFDRGLTGRGLPAEPLPSPTPPAGGVWREGVEEAEAGRAFDAPLGMDIDADGRDTPVVPPFVPPPELSALDDLDGMGPPSAAPVALAASVSRSAGLLGSFARARTSVPQRARAPAPASSARRGGDAEPPAARPDERMLSFGRLRMPGPEELGRGALVLVTEQSLYLQLLVEQRVELAFDVPRALAAAVEAAESVAALPPPPGHRFPAGTGHAHAYPARAAVDVPSDGELHSVPLLVEEGPLEVRYVTVPRESQDVFRVVEWPSPSDAPLLEGPVDLSVDGRYLLTGKLSEVPPRGVLRLGLGLEPAIKVSRNTRYAEETRGLMGGSLALEHGIEVELRSHMDRPALVEVRERLPTTHEEEEEIAVEVTRVEPRWEPFEQDEAPLRGGRLWRVRLEPGGEARLEARYAVRISSKHQLVGGNRREG